MNTPTTTDVFISYSSHNEIFAELLRMKLLEANFSIWKDTDRIKPSEDWRKLIDYGLKNSSIILVLFDKISAISPYVTYEWSFALGAGKTIVPLLLEECELHPVIKSLKYLDFKNRENNWWMLIDFLNVLKIQLKEKQLQNNASINELFQQAKKLYNKKYPESTEANEAMEILEKILALYPQCIDAQRLKAGIYFDRRQYRKAAYLWEEMLESCQNSRNYFLVGLAYRMNKEYEKALHYLQIAVYLDENYSNAHKNLGYVYDALGNKEAAQKHYDLSKI